MLVDKLIDDIVFNISDEINDLKEYKETNLKIIELQKNLNKILNEEGKSILLQLCDLETQSEAIATHYCCKKVLSSGVTLIK